MVLELLHTKPKKIAYMKKKDSIWYTQVFVSFDYKRKKARLRKQVRYCYLSMEHRYVLKFLRNSDYFCKRQRKFCLRGCRLWLSYKNFAIVYPCVIARGDYMGSNNITGAYASHSSSSWDCVDFKYHQLPFTILYSFFSI
jgi:hypothetical protein